MDELISDCVATRDSTETLNTITRLISVPQNAKWE